MKKYWLRFKDIFFAFKALFTGLPKWQNETEYPVQFAFRWEGKEYFTFTDPHNMPYHRGLTAMNFMEEVNMKITEEFMDAWLAGLEAELNHNPIRLLEIVRLIKMLKDRKNFVVAPDTIYKLASVLFFTKEESTLMYDVVYNAQKIKSWKRSNTKFDFFLHLPLQGLLPFLTQSPEDTVSFFQATQARILEDLVTLRLVLSQDESQNDLIKLLESQIRELTESIYSD
jgi:hypothetical protein